MSFESQRQIFFFVSIILKFHLNNRNMYIFSFLYSEIRNVTKIIISHLL